MGTSHLSPGPLAHGHLDGRWRPALLCGRGFCGGRGHPQCAVCVCVYVCVCVCRGEDAGDVRLEASTCTGLDRERASFELKKEGVSQRVVGSRQRGSSLSLSSSDGARLIQSQPDVIQSQPDVLVLFWLRVFKFIASGTCALF